MSPYSVTRLQWVNEGCHEDTMTWKYFPNYWPMLEGIHITLEGPKDPLLRNSRFLRSRDLDHASVTFGPDPLGFDWEDLAASRGTVGGHSGPPLVKQLNSLGIDSLLGRFKSPKTSYVDLCCFLVCSLKTLLNKQLGCPWYKMPWCSYDITVMMLGWVNAKDTLDQELCLFANPAIYNWTEDNCHCSRLKKCVLEVFVTWYVSGFSQEVLSDIPLILSETVTSPKCVMWKCTQFGLVMPYGFI